VAVSRPNGQGLHRIEQWSLTGGRWARSAILSDADQQNVRPFYVRGAPAGMNWRLLWLRGTYGDFLNFHLRLVGADPGPRLS
jgi:hypothetical protein